MAKMVTHAANLYNSYLVSINLTFAGLKEPRFLSVTIRAAANLVRHREGLRSSYPYLDIIEVLLRSSWSSTGGVLGAAYHYREIHEPPQNSRGRKIGFWPDPKAHRARVKKIS